ncbi:MAG: hypothetical protein PHY64_08650 [Eubacteriales bacterium]|nr:hypothetical protein [Eubacteriales bacterium]
MMVLQRLARACDRTGRFFSERYVSRKTLALACVVVFVGMLIPLAVIALYNYPADDDFASALPAATAWVQTHDIGQVWNALCDYAVKTFTSWQGDYVSSFFCTLTPMIVSLKLYFLSNWFVLALLCLSVGYLVKALVRTLLGGGRADFWIVYTAMMVLVLQFMPEIGQGIYWHTGGMYIVAFCAIVQAMGLLVHCAAAQGRARAVWRGVALALCGVMIGGSFFGPAFGAVVFFTLYGVVALVQKHPNRRHALVLVAFMLASFAVSVTSPGNALRQARLGDPMNPVTAVATAVLDSFDVAGGWLSPQLLALLGLVLPVLYRPLRDSSLSFRHPFWFFVLLYGLFSATLVPGVYTGMNYTMGRYYNVIYFEFLLLVFGSVAYAEGWLIRFLQRRGEASPTAEHLLTAARNAGTRFTALYLALCLMLLAFGGFGYTIMNTASVSAAKSILTGEAAAFRAEMAEREAYIRDTDSDDTQISVLGAQPYVFKADKLPFQGIYGRVRYMKWYFELFYNSQQP